MMIDLHQDHDSEIAAIVASTAALSRLADDEARRRVLSYVLARCLPEPDRVLGAGSAPSTMAMPHPSVAVVEHTQRELPGIACLAESGEFRITVCDLKARSRLAAAVRLAQIAIYAHERLTGRPLSSRKGLTPLLKAWGLYDGNTRARLAKEPGIVRSDDSLSLDPQARRRAEQVIEELQSSTRGAAISPAMGGPQPELHEPSSRPPHFENWDNFANKCSVSLHAVDGVGTILWANDTELALMGYAPEEYIGRFIGDFHVDQEVVQDILDRLTKDETVNAYPARLRAKDGSIKHVMINSNVYRHRNGEFEHSRCFTTSIGEAAWKALKRLQKR
jgi:PAS domain S-box-containing protein